jgi:hypothetical protein
LGLSKKGDAEIKNRQETRNPGHCSGVDYFLAQKSEENIEN